MLLSDALAQLSAEHRAVIRRSYYQGWTTAQIAADLDIAEGTVKSRLHYAARALRLALHRQMKIRVGGLCAHGRAGGPGVLRGIGKRLGQHVIGGDFDGLGYPSLQQGPSSGGPASSARGPARLSK
jgi:hypothetical protein